MKITSTTTKKILTKKEKKNELKTNVLFEKLIFSRATKSGYKFLVAIYECDVGSEFENAQYNRLYCSQESWIHNSYYPTCTSTGESDGKKFYLFVPSIIKKTEKKFKSSSFICYFYFVTCTHHTCKTVLQTYIYRFIFFILFFERKNGIFTIILMV